jgi:hydrogenase nickel incorporation protein HypA/HybF
MHELYITECLLKTARESLPPEVPPEAVQSIIVQVGALDAVVPETLLFLFDSLKGSSGMPNAELQIETIEVLCHCKECGHEFGVELPVFICEHCGSGCVDVVRGRGITLTRIVAEDRSPESVVA